VFLRRYYGLEALYNIAKVSRQSFLRYFSDTFDSLFRLCADSETRVQARRRFSLHCVP
jgi:vacuole morphology and inheritance protein 14